MNRKNDYMMIPEPADGWEPYEREFLRYTILEIYRKINDPQDRFIFLATQEVGYTQADVAYILCLTQEAINKRMQTIRTRLLKLRAKGRI